MEKVKQIIEMYERQIENLRWHLQTNKDFIDVKEESIIMQKLRDRLDFVDFLKAI